MSTVSVTKEIILGSSSPRRAEILKGANIACTVIKPQVEEIFSETLLPEEAAMHLAEIKAQWFNNTIKENQIVITADTIVAQNNSILGKPKNRKNAFEMIQSLSNNTHKVMTGVSLLSTKKSVTFCDTTTVYFKPLTDIEIEFYIDVYKPYDKAGAYGIQEWIGMIGIDKIEGSYYNVMGLPIHKVYAALKEDFNY